MAVTAGRSGVPAAPYGLPGHLVDFVEALRKRGIAVGPSETVDAGQVMSVLDLLDRESVREGLACALLQAGSHGWHLRPHPPRSPRRGE